MGNWNRESDVAEVPGARTVAASTGDAGPLGVRRTQTLVVDGPLETVQGYFGVRDVHRGEGYDLRG